MASKENLMILDIIKINNIIFEVTHLDGTQIKIESAEPLTELSGEYNGSGIKLMGSEAYEPFTKLF